MKTSRMHSKLYLFLLLILLYISSFAQKEDYNWALSNNILINFESQPPTVSTSIQNIRFGISCISDKNGNLLFYGDRKHFYDGNNNLLYSLPDSLGVQFKTIICPKPNSSTEYFAFICAMEYLSTTTLRHIIQLNLKTNGNEGELVKSKILKSGKNFNSILLVSKHSNNTDYWLITNGDSDKSLNSYLISKDTIELKYVSYFDQNISHSSRSDIRLSPEFSKIVYSRSDNESIAFLDFDNQTGKLSNMQFVKLSSDYVMPTFEYSPNGEYLYCSFYQNDTTTIWQYPISTSTGTIFSDKAKLIFKDKIREITDMQLSPNDEIIINEKGNEYLGKIINPDLEPPLCYFSRDEIYLNGKITLMELPDFPNYRTNFYYKRSCTNSDFNYYGAPTLSQTWNFGDSHISTEQNPTHNYALPGKYTVTLKVIYNDNSEKIITKQITITEKPEKPVINY